MKTYDLDFGSKKLGDQPVTLTEDWLCAIMLLELRHELPSGVEMVSFTVNPVRDYHHINVALIIENRSYNDYAPVTASTTLDEYSAICQELASALCVRIGNHEGLIVVTE